MDSDTMFETRLVRALRDYTDQVVLPFDPDEVVAQAIGLRHQPMRLRVLLVPLVALALLLALAIGVVTLSTPDDPAPSPAVNAFKGGTLRSAAGDGHSATLLPDGRVLVITGAWRGMGGATVPSAEVWDPVEGSSTRAGSLVTGRPHATATLLTDGRVLVVGGFGGYAYSSTALATVEVWDAESGAFREAGSLAQPRVGHTATRLQDGRVLVIGGSGPDGQLASAEVWDPTTERFRSAGSLATTRGGHTATLLSDGGVLVVGGSTTGDGATMSFVTGAELWDPSTGSFIPAGELVEPRAGHTATLLSDGRVLVVGGFIGSGYTSSLDDEGRSVVLDAPAGLVDGHLASAEVWDSSSLSFGATGGMSQARTRHTATLLTDGRVAVVGGAGIRVEGEAMFRRGASLRGGVGPRDRVLRPSQAAGQPATGPQRDVPLERPAAHRRREEWRHRVRVEIHRGLGTVMLADIVALFQSSQDKLAVRR
jgi:hypothetical protein